MHQKFYLRGINAKEVLITLKGDEFKFPVADGTAKLSGRETTNSENHYKAETNRKE